MTKYELAHDYIPALQTLLSHTRSVPELSLSEHTYARLRQDVLAKLDEK